MQRETIRFLFLNVGHFLDHFFVLIFATVAALRLTIEWDLTYAQLIPYATPGFVAFGLCAIPAGWLADKWSREGMMVVFFIGIGLSSIYTGMADTPLQIGIGLTLVGIFAAIYHPVGLAMVVQGREKMGIPLAVNGVFGNMGVACAALVTGFFIDNAGWRSAFYLPGVLSIAIGVAYLVFERRHMAAQESQNVTKKAAGGGQGNSLGLLARVFGIVFFTTALSGMIFQSTTFALPKIFDERLGDLAISATAVGFYAFLVFSIAAFAQLVVGYLLDRYQLRMIFAFIAALQAVLFGVMVSLTGLPALLVAIGFMLAVFGNIPVKDVLVGRMAKTTWRSRAYAINYLVSFSVSASAVPVIAYIHSTWGFDRLFELLAIIAVVIFVAAMLLPREDTQYA